MANPRIKRRRLVAFAHEAEWLKSNGKHLPASVERAARYYWVDGLNYRQIEQIMNLPQTTLRGKVLMAQGAYEYAMSIRRAMSRHAEKMEAESCA